MNINMEWIKKNWMWIAVAALVIAVIVYYVRKNKKDGEITLKLPKIPGLQGRGTAPAGESSESAKAKLDECYQGLANVKLNPNMPHPCAALKDAYESAKKAESSYAGGEISNPVVDMAIGQDGLALANAM